MRATTPRFSIVIPCYNEALFIAQTLRSIQQQRYAGSYEVIVVDNNCDDDTAAIARSFGARLVTESHPGVCWARQAGAAAAKGDIIISTDADTTFPADWLQTIDHAFERHSDSAAVVGPCHYTDGPRWGGLYTNALFALVRLSYQLTGRPMYVTATNIAFKKSAWTAYDTTMTQGGDELALLHDLQKQGRIVYLHRNVVQTSGRRLSRGFAYSFFVTFLTYYLLAYYVNKLFRRTVIGMAPAFRNMKVRHGRLSVAYRLVVLLLLALLLHLPGHDTMAQQSVETASAVKHLIQRHL